VHVSGAAKFTISMPEDLLAEIDAAAEAAGTTRSGVIREAAAHYVVARRAESLAVERRLRVTAALDRMKSIAAQPKADDRPTLEVLRELRRGHGFEAPGSSDEPGDAE